VAALRATALPGGDDHDWYRALPPQLRAQLTQIEFLDLLGRLREAGIVTTSPAGANQLIGSPGKLRLRLPWR
jgi:Cdc6-like AAA superfamily ATPase